MNSTSNAISREQFFAYQLLIEIVQLLISILGIIFNVALIYVILHNKPFRTSYGLFLAICCLSDAGTASISFLPVILTLLDHRISFIACLMAQFPAQIGLLLSNANILFISMDRLFAVIYPIEHYIPPYMIPDLDINTLFYKIPSNTLALLNCIPLVMFGCLLFSQFSYGLQHPQISMYCNLVDLGGGNGNMATAFIFFFAESTVTLITYSIILIILRVTKRNRNAGNAESQREQTRRISKSIMVIVCVIFFCTFICEMGVLFVTPRASADPQVQYLLRRAFIQPMSFFTGVINAPVLYFCSKDYRELMKKEFRIVRWLSNKFSPAINNIVVPMPHLCASSAEANN